MYMYIIYVYYFIVLYGVVLWLRSCICDVYSVGVGAYDAVWYGMRCYSYVGCCYLLLKMLAGALKSVKNRLKINWENGPGVWAFCKIDFSGYTETRLFFDPKIAVFSRVARNEGLV